MKNEEIAAFLAHELHTGQSKGEVAGVDVGDRHVVVRRRDGIKIALVWKVILPSVEAQSVATKEADVQEIENYLQANLVEQRENDQLPPVHLTTNDHVELPALANQLYIDPDRAASSRIPLTRITTQAFLGDKVDVYDITYLTKESLLRWLRANGGENTRAEDVLGILLGHGRLSEKKTRAPK